MLSRLPIHLYYQKTDDLLTVPDKIKSYTVPVSNVDDVKFNPNIIDL